jgi:hypothetical protein
MSFLKKLFGIKDQEIAKKSIDIPVKEPIDIPVKEPIDVPVKEPIDILTMKYSINPKSLVNESDNISMEKNDQSAATDNECIMVKYIEKYLLDKTPKFKYSILDFPESFGDGEFNSLEYFKNLCNNLIEFNNNDRKSSSSIGNLRSIDCLNEEYSCCLLFFEDLSKLAKLFRKKGIETNEIKIYKLTIILIRNYLDKLYDKYMLDYYEVIKSKVDGEVSHECVIRAILDSKLEAINSSALSDEALFWTLSIFLFDEDSEVTRAAINSDPGLFLNDEAKLWLLNKFNLSCTKNELRTLIEKIEDDIELENFEKNLGSINNVNSGKITIPNFSSLNGYEFEEFLLDLFVDLGYRVIKTPDSRDQGADLILYKNNISIVVQAKNYEGKVPNSAIQQIVAAKNYYKADIAMVVTNSIFTKSAVELAYANDVDLWDGNKLREVINSL